ncbi:MAG: hypothetical protein ACLS4A_12765 [Oscillospiraceae bacterium]
MAAYKEQGIPEKLFGAEALPRFTPLQVLRDEKRDQIFPHNHPV